MDAPCTTSPEFKAQVDRIKDCLLTAGYNVISIGRLVGVEMSPVRVYLRAARAFSWHSPESAQQKLSLYRNQAVKAVAAFHDHRLRPGWDHERVMAEIETIVLAPVRHRPAVSETQPTVSN